jgi:hypothetical protein
VSVTGSTIHCQKWSSVVPLITGRQPEQSKRSPIYTNVKLTLSEPRAGGDDEVSIVCCDNEHRGKSVARVRSDADIKRNCRYLSVD